MQAGASSKECPVSVGMKDPSKPSWTECTTSKRCWELGASVGYVCRLPYIEESLWLRSIKVVAVCYCVGEGWAGGTVEEEGAEAKREELGW